MDDMKIKKGNGCFYIGESKATALAEVTFVPVEDSKVAINHTYVSPELRGQKVARKLIDCVAKYCRDEKLKAIPVCSYAVSVMEDSDEYEDIISDWYS